MVLLITSHSIFTSPSYINLFCEGERHESVGNEIPDENRIGEEVLVESRTNEEVPFENRNEEVPSGNGTNEEISTSKLNISS